MSRLILWNVMTLDGCFEGAKGWDLGFHKYAWGPELEHFGLEQLRAADRLLFGRVTYEGMAAYWQTAKGEDADLMNSIPKVVVSRTLTRVDWANSTLLKGDLVSGIQALKHQGDKNTFVFGSANLSATLIEHRLFDEYRIAISPVLLGCGKPLFSPLPAQQPLKLLEARTFSNGCVILRYQPINQQVCPEGNP